MIVVSNEYIAAQGDGYAGNEIRKVPSTTLFTVQPFPQASRSASLFSASSMSFSAPLNAFVVFVSYVGSSSFASSSSSLVWRTAAWTVRNSEGEKRFCRASKLDDAGAVIATAGAGRATCGLLTS